jgi:hypothetical protein
VITVDDEAEREKEVLDGYRKRWIEGGEVGWLCIQWQIRAVLNTKRF